MKSSGSVEAAVAIWAGKELPARLNVPETAKLLGFAEHDIQILMAAGKLEPLGDPAPNAPKWFAAVDVIRLAADRDWLHKATREISKYWKHKRERRVNSRDQSTASAARTREKVSPNSSPKVSPEGQSEGSERAVVSSEQVVAKSA